MARYSMTATHEELGNSLVECLHEIRSLMEYSHSAAMNQQKSLVSNDAEGIVLATKAQEEVLRRVGEADQRAAAISKQLALEAGLDPENVGTEMIGQAAGSPYSEMITAETRQIASLAAMVQRANEVNRVLLQNGLDIVTECLRAVAVAPSTTYSVTGVVPDNPASVLSLDRKV
jgi:hypothetical protein